MQAKAPGAASDVFSHRHSSGRFRVPASFAPASRNSTTRASRARLALRLNPLRRFSRRRKRWPHPVLLLKRRRRIGRGDHSPLPHEASLGQLSGRPIVEAVVRGLADSNQIPAAPLPAWEILNRVDMVHCRRGFVSAIAASLAALVAVAPQDCIPQAQPSLALVVRLGSPPFHPASQIKQKRHDLTTEIMALMPSGYHLGCKTKAPNDLPFTRSNHLAQALAQRLWLRLIFTFTTDSRLHILQYSGKSVSVVVGSTRCCVGRPHSGQISLPPADTNSISCAFLLCKTFVPPF